MAVLPTNRTTANTISEHVDDHNELHTNHNVWQAIDPADLIRRAGTVTFTADQPMGGFKLTGLAAGTVNGDSVRFEQLSAKAEDADVFHDNVAGEIAGLTLVTAAAADHVLINDASDSNNLKRVTAQSIADLASPGGGTDADAIHDNVAAEISAITEKVTPAAGDWVLIEDSAASNVKKKAQVGNLVANTGWQYVDHEIISATGTSAVSFTDTDWGTDAEDLLIIITARTDRAANNGDGFRLRMGSTGSVDAGATNYMWHERTQGSGTSNTDSGAGGAGIDSDDTAPFTAASADAGAFGSAAILLPGIPSTTQHQIAKWQGGRSAGTSDHRSAYGEGRWKNTGAIDIVEIATLSGDDFSTGTRVVLYKRALNSPGGGGGGGGGGTVAAASGNKGRWLASDGSTWIAVKGRGESIETYHTGTLAGLYNGTEDAGPALRAAQAALSASGQILLPGDGAILNIKTFESFDGQSVGCHLQEGQGIEGAGPGSGRTGGAGVVSHGPTTIGADATCDYVLYWRSASGSPSWLGTMLKGVHVKDMSAGENVVGNALIGIRAINEARLIEWSASHANAVGASALEIIEASGGQTTQYGICRDFDIWECYHGITALDNSPDWLFVSGSLQRSTGGGFDTGTRGFNLDSSAVYFRDIYGAQDYDYGLYIDASVSNEGKHLIISGWHSEVHTSYADNIGTAAFYMKGGTANEGVLMTDIQFANPTKYTDLIVLDNVQNFRGTNIYKRGNSGLLTTGDSRWSAINGSAGTLNGTSF